MRDRVRQQRSASFQGNAECKELRNSGKNVAGGTGREKLKVLQLDLKIYLTCFSSEDAWKTVHEKDEGQLAETNI